MIYITTIVAECGANWDTIPKAKEMIKKSKESGADLCKFQYFTEEDIKNHPKFERLKQMCLNYRKAKELFDYGNKLNLEVFFTPESADNIDTLEKIGVRRYKIRHTDVKNRELLKRIWETEKPTILSVTFEDRVEPLMKARDLLSPIDPTVLYCVAKYPPKKSELHLERMRALIFEGYSNHYPSIFPCLVAVAYGKKIVETHVMLEGTDCIDKAVSITFSELKRFVSYAKEMGGIL